LHLLLSLKIDIIDIGTPVKPEIDTSSPWYCFANVCFIMYSKLKILYCKNHTKKTYPSSIVYRV